MAIRDLATLIAAMVEQRVPERLVRNTRLQFGLRGRRLLGPSILPERVVPNNAYREESVKYRSIIANHATRYSPVQLKGGVMTGWVDVMLAESDAGAELTSQDYDILISLLRNNSSMRAQAQIIRFLDTAVAQPLIERNEADRWRALVDAQVVLQGDNGYYEEVNYSNPAGHRAAAGGQFSNDAYDPINDFFAMADLFASKGLTLRRIIGSRNVTSLLAGNAKIAARSNRITVSSTGQIGGISPSRLSSSRINGMLQMEGLPPIEEYDLQYRTATGTERFLEDDVLVFIAGTEREEELDLGDTVEVIPDTLGYVGIGRTTGQSTAGRVSYMKHVPDEKPPRIEAQGWQTSLPVILEPEAVGVIHTIS